VGDCVKGAKIVKKLLLVTATLLVATPVFGRASSGPPIINVHMKKGEYCWSYKGSAWVQFTGQFAQWQIMTVSATKFTRIHGPAGEIGGELDGMNVHQLTIKVQFRNRDANLETIDPGADGGWWIPETNGNTTEVWINLDDPHPTDIKTFAGAPPKAQVDIWTVNTPGP
jgi:hypothetical protein